RSAMIQIVQELLIRIPHGIGLAIVLELRHNQRWRRIAWGWCRTRHLGQALPDEPGRVRVGAALPSPIGEAAMPVRDDVPALRGRVNRWTSRCLNLSECGEWEQTDEECE